MTTETIGVPPGEQDEEQRQKGASEEAQVRPVLEGVLSRSIFDVSRRDGSHGPPEKQVRHLLKVFQPPAPPTGSH